MRIRNLNPHLVVLVSFSLAILLSTIGVSGQAESPAPFEAKPISAVLNPDGTVKQGMSGSFDPKGFRMVAGPKGQPKFVQTENVQNMGAPAGCADAWDSRFAAPGVAVSAAATDGSGNVYVGGTFLSIGGVAASQIAKWDGTSWTALGLGVTGSSTANIGVTSIAISGTDVFVGGYFTTAGGNSANSVAKWNGTAWSSLGTGLTGPGGAGVVALAVLGQNVYVAGLFTTAGAVPANNIANGTARPGRLSVRELPGSSSRLRPQVLTSTLAASFPPRVEFRQTGSRSGMETPGRPSVPVLTVSLTP